MKEGYYKLALGFVTLSTGTVAYWWNRPNDPKNLAIEATKYLLEGKLKEVQKLIDKGADTNAIFTRDNETTLIGLENVEALALFQSFRPEESILTSVVRWHDNPYNCSKVASIKFITDLTNRLTFSKEEFTNALKLAFDELRMSYQRPHHSSSIDPMKVVLFFIKGKKAEVPTNITLNGQLPLESVTVSGEEITKNTLVDWAHQVSQDGDIDLSDPETFQTYIASFKELFPAFPQVST